MRIYRWLARVCWPNWYARQTDRTSLRISSAQVAKLSTVGLAYCKVHFLVTEEQIHFKHVFQYETSAKPVISCSRVLNLPEPLSHTSLLFPQLPLSFRSRTLHVTSFYYPTHTMSHSSHDHGSGSDMASSATAMSDMDTGDQFCEGDGTVMLMGFQVSPPAAACAADAHRPDPPPLGAAATVAVSRPRAHYCGVESVIILC